ncbi:bifunctional hydroxymethylpyrimidine kinase/phosphomethylpyrimidine kinase [Thermogladius sp. 4427co]|uniref:bifunctional hydroxymethylpyrimidine kinase/phosphomethylpyrimidine kinase n=1 Tax=Thermogladius sp. 4427co TaxID=3450718 RepID=UPI003F7A344E
MPKIPTALTIAGSDSSGGAGIEADLKTFSALGVYGAVAITCVTAQNTYAVLGVFCLPGRIVYEQIRSVYEDIGIDAVKTGMLGNADIVDNIADAISDLRLKNIVVDPVLSSKTGFRLLDDEGLERLRKRILPQSLLVTPNAIEAGVLSGMRVESLEEAKQAARKISSLYGVPAVLVKGGHLKEKDSIDVLYFDGDYYFFTSPRMPQGCFHGAGCSFSAAITSMLARGVRLVEAVEKAKEFINVAIKYGTGVGRGFCPVDPLAYLYIPASKYRAIESVMRAVDILLEKQDLLLPYVPEVGMNIAEAIEARFVNSIEDVIAVEGRIVRAGRRLVKVGDIKPGGSSHLARLLISLIKRGFDVRGAVNVGYSKQLIEKAIAKGYKVVFVDRRREPLEIKHALSGSMEWIASQVEGSTPDIIYDEGDVGKEPMIRVLGSSAVDAVEKLLSIL